ncbi:hypothetical protein PQG02_32475 (plasmid) [Nostoc sp. UHCC 0926]|nr:hypothetical protein PQG02_32475 [Nostoc sp. UHCC 0926]
MIFIFEERPSDSSFVETIWRTRSESAGSFISRAVKSTSFECGVVVFNYEPKQN